MESIATGWFAQVAATAFGLAVGSFANVVIYRSPRDGLSSFRPARSFCPHCNAPVRWHDNIPVLSWIALSGRCRSCRQPISPRYLVVELLVAALFLAAVVLWPPVDSDSMVRLGVAFYLATVCVIVTLVDFEHLIIPDSITWPGMVLGLLASLAFPVLHATHRGFHADQPHASSLIASVFGMVAGGGSLMVVGAIGNRLMKRKLQEAGVPDSMGWGDVKWMALAGTFLGVDSVLSAILIGCFAGAVVGIALKVVARVRREESPIGVPFGPFLSLGILAELVSPGLAFTLLASLARASAPA